MEQVFNISGINQEMMVMFFNNSLGGNGFILDAAGNVGIGSATLS